jgi:DNA cross-link repair 1A protein
MGGHKEREQWKDVEIDLKRDGKRIMGRRKAPFYKVSTFTCESIARLNTTRS